MAARPPPVRFAELAKQLTPPMGMQSRRLA